MIFFKKICVGKDPGNLQVHLHSALGLTSKTKFKYVFDLDVV